MLSKGGFAQTDNDQIGFTAIKEVEVFTHNKYATRYVGYAYRLNPVLSINGGLGAGYYFTVYKPKNNIANLKNMALLMTGGVSVPV